MNNSDQTILQILKKKNDLPIECQICPKYLPVMLGYLPRLINLNIQVFDSKSMVKLIVSCKNNVRNNN